MDSGHAFLAFGKAGSSGVPLWLPRRDGRAGRGREAFWNSPGGSHGIFDLTQLVLLRHGSEIRGALRIGTLQQQAHIGAIVRALEACEGSSLVHKEGKYLRAPRPSPSP